MYHCIFNILFKLNHAWSQMWVRIDKYQAIVLLQPCRNSPLRKGITFSSANLALNNISKPLTFCRGAYLSTSCGIRSGRGRHMDFTYNVHGLLTIRQSTKNALRCALLLNSNRDLSSSSASAVCFCWNELPGES